MASKGNELRTLRIISAAMIGGILLFLAVALFMRQALRPSGLELVGYLACGWALVSVPLADVFRSARWPATTPEQDPNYWSKRSGAHLVSIGLVEGAALFCCVSLMVSNVWWPLVAILVPLGATLAWFPRDA